MNRKLLIAALVFVLGIDSLAIAGVSTRWRANRRRARTSTVYRSTDRQYYRTPSRSTSQTQKPWYINSEPAFNSYRTRILYNNLGYPGVFPN